MYRVSANRTNGNKLTPRQFDVVWYVTKGMKNKEIADKLGTTEFVIKNHLRVVYDKLGFNNRVEIALWLIQKLHTGEI